MRKLTSPGVSLVPRSTEVSRWAILALALVGSILFGCRKSAILEDAAAGKDRASTGAAEEFRWEAERFADVAVLRYQVPGFEELPLKQKELIYNLYEAALVGREIIFDQKHRHNLAIKRTLERIWRAYPGDRTTEAFAALEVYLKRIWFSNGIHHHYSNDKFEPGFTAEDLERWVKATPGEYPVREGQSVDQLLAELRPTIFDPSVDRKLVEKGRGKDLVAESAVNFYHGLTQSEVEAYHAARDDAGNPRPISHGLNSRLVRGENGIEEQVWRVGGTYGVALERIVHWLQRAALVAENAAQREALLRLAIFFVSGDLEDWDRYNIAWVRDTESVVDTINGFIEVYNDPMGYRGSYEGIVSLVDPIASRRIELLAREAQWFEDNSSISPEHKKASVAGISARVIQVVVESGDSSPATPIGINLPNANWIRKEHGSKSVNLANIVNAYNQVRGAALAEFAFDEAEVARAKTWGEIADALHTDLHEVLGHASGQIEPGVKTPKETLKNYASTLEEARADLVALYFITDPKLVELGLAEGPEMGRSAYDRYIRNGLVMQLQRVRLGDEIEEDHMRNRQLIAKWVFEKGEPDRVVERVQRDGKTFFVVRDYDRLRVLFGDLLREVQRIKSQGDFEAGERLVEEYGVKVDPELHAEVLERFETLDIPAYSGFINPVLRPVHREGKLVDVRIEYPEDFATQMLDYSERYGILPTWN